MYKLLEDELLNDVVSILPDVCPSKCYLYRGIEFVCGLLKQQLDQLRFEFFLDPLVGCLWVTDLRSHTHIDSKSELPEIGSICTRNLNQLHESTKASLEVLLDSLVSTSLLVTLGIYGYG